MGAVFRVPLGRFDDAPSPRVALVPGEGRPLWELTLGERVTFVLGAERAGLPADVLAGCDEIVHVPRLPGSESLNVAIAGSIALYERRRRQ
jgi:TrmH family RNA methyltransferase